MIEVPVASPTVRRVVGEHAAGDADAILVDDEHDRRYLFVVDGSRLYQLDAATADRIARSLADGDIAGELARLGLAADPLVDDQPLAPPPVRAVSLAVAQKCNLGCTYCYAQQGDFGMEPRSMTSAEAERAIDLALAGVAPGERVTVAFMGGEPLLNRSVVRGATEYARRRGSELGADVALSITTNGTLVNEDDAEFFEHHRFAVTVSVDGDRETHDRLRPARSGQGTYDRILERIAPLLSRQRRMQVSARVTVTPANLSIDATVSDLLALGFHSVGVSPMLSSPTGHGEVGSDHLEVLLDHIIAAGRTYERRTLMGERYAFANMANAMREIDRGTHRPYPCGAGAGYVGVGAGGVLSACHRFVGDAAGYLGTIDLGLDQSHRDRWLVDRHVHRQTPCSTCWARYLCGGGCHHEVIHRGRPACEYIRGWLRYCLGAYARLSAAGVSFVGDDR